MWRRVELRNYRSIEHVTVDLSPFAVLVGPNGSGKSNFVDALLFARDVGIDAASAVQRRGGITGVRRSTPGDPVEIQIEVRAAVTKEALDTDYDAHLLAIQSERSGAWRFSHERIQSVQGGKPKLLLERTGTRIELRPAAGQSSFQAFSVGSTASAMVLARQLVLFEKAEVLGRVRGVSPNPEALRQPQLATHALALDESGSTFAAAFRDLGPAAQENVKRAMAKIIPGLCDITIDPIERYLYLRFTQAQAGGHQATFSAMEMSEGALRALCILTATERMAQDELLIVEEPEVSIHVGAAGLLFDVLKRASERGAVLLTTHSADLLDAARDEEILVSDYQGGTTSIGLLSTAQREIVKEGLFSIAELMRSERLRIEGAPARILDPREA